MNKQPKFPQQIAVKFELIDDEPSMIAALSEGYHAELGETIRVGVYRLIEEREVTCRTASRVINPKARSR